MRVSNPQNALFKIDIKLSGQIISIPVFEGQNHETLIKRFCDQHLMKSSYQQAVKNKIIQCLLTTIKKAEISASLKDKVNYFLNQNHTIQQNNSKASQKQKHQKYLYPKSNVSTPFKMLGQGQQSVDKNQSKGNSKNTKTTKTTYNQLERVSKQLQAKRNKAQCIRKNNKRYSDYNKPQNQVFINKSLGKSKIQDTDLITAYQTIYKKSKQLQMKKMAKQFLQENGFFKQEREPLLYNKKILEESFIHKSDHKAQRILARKQLSPQHKQIILNKDNPNNMRHEYKIKKANQYQEVQPFEISQTPTSQKNRSHEQSSKKKRIKYDIGQQNIQEQYSAPDYEYSNYHFQQYNPGPKYHSRGSFSYERLPYNYNYNYNQNMGLCKNYESDLQQGRQRSVNLRKTRKYKYL